MLEIQASRQCNVYSSIAAVYNWACRDALSGFYGKRTAHVASFVPLAHHSEQSILK